MVQASPANEQTQTLSDDREPKANIDRCHEHTETIHAFGKFVFDQKEVSLHYDKYADMYDAMQEMTGFNDPYELVKIAMEKLGGEG